MFTQMLTQNLKNRHKTGADVDANVDAKSEIRRKSDANPMQRKQWILEYLKENSKITRKILCDKFSLSKESASRDLRKLIADDKIVKKGGGNNVWYEFK